MEPELVARRLRIAGLSTARRGKPRRTAPRWSTLRTNCRPALPTDDFPESSRRAHEGLSAVKRVTPGLLLLLFVAVSAGRSYAAAGGAIVSGTVRDVHGTPQMGALVQLLRVDMTPAATAFSDDHGRYVISAMVPGRYELRATAAFFAPLLRNNIVYSPGVQSIVNPDAECDV